MELHKESALEALGMMERSRHFEERIQQYFNNHAMHGTTHLSIGQEASQEGLSLALGDGDWIVPTHRNHGFAICRGADIRAMFSEMWGSRKGICKGLGGSMHMTDSAHWNAGGDAVVGSCIPLAMGLALALKQQGTDRLAVACFGDGATSRGTLHESMNLASLWKLPLLFYCENNGYGMSAPVEKAVATDSIAKRAEGYRMPWARVDGNDLMQVFEATEKAVSHIRTSGGPYFLEVLTYRENGHSKSDVCAYRTRSEEEAWRRKDPIERFVQTLVREGVCSREEAQTVLQNARTFVDRAAREAEADKDDVLDLEEAERYVYVPETITEEVPAKKTHVTSYRLAIREALDEEMSRDKNVLFWGEDIGVYGGCFKVSGDLYKKHPSQVRETPVSEESFTGMAVGASLLGMRPVVEIMYGDFMTLASDPLVNHAAKMRFMSAGQLSSPLVVRPPLGSGTGHGAQHTQSLESMFSGIPGLVVVAPSDPYSAKALLKASIHSDNPVVFFEHKLLYDTMGEVGDEEALLPLGKCRVLKTGRDLTIVSYSRAVLTSLEAAKTLEAEGISSEVIDLCTLRPLDMDTILASVRKTRRLLVVEEGNSHGSYGEDVVSQVAEQVDLRSRPLLLAGKDLPVPFTPTLEKQMVADVDDVVESARRLLGR